MDSAPFPLHRMGLCSRYGAHRNPRARRLVGLALASCPPRGQRAQAVQGAARQALDRGAAVQVRAVTPAQLEAAVGERAFDLEEMEAAGPGLLARRGEIARLAES